jgi:hypothetical protein
MLVPLGRPFSVPGADRLDPYGTLRYRNHIVFDVTGMTVSIGKSE